MKREKIILCALLMFNAAMLMAGAIWVNNDAYHRRRDVWNMFDPWPDGQPKAIINYYPPSLFDYSSGVFFILCVAVSFFAYFNLRKITKDRADLSKAICNDIWVPIMRAFVGMAAALLIVRYVMAQFDHLAFISLIQIHSHPTASA